MTDQTPDLAALEALAEAIDGEWACSHDEPSTHRPPDTYDVYLADGSAEVLANLPWELAAYIAAADPQTVLWLIREVERLDREVRHLRPSERRAGAVSVQAQARAEKAEATIERVRAALANHPKACEAHPDEDPISCGWKRAVLDVQTALDGGESR